MYALPDGSPIPSIRLKVIADSMEDYEYLILLRDAAEKQKNNGGPVARMPPLSCHQRAEGLRLSILEHFPVCNASRSKPSSLSIHGKRGFSAWFRPGGAVTPPRVFPFFKGKTL